MERSRLEKAHKRPTPAPRTSTSIRRTPEQLVPAEYAPDIRGVVRAAYRVFDTNCYQKVVVQIRDPIIGPVKAALRPNGQLVLVGATAKGVVIATLPNTFTTTCP